MNDPFDGIRLRYRDFELTIGGGILAIVVDAISRHLKLTIVVTILGTIVGAILHYLG